jgi:hypothetical protein
MEEHRRLLESGKSAAARLYAGVRTAVNEFPERVPGNCSAHAWIVTAGALGFTFEVTGNDFLASSESPDFGLLRIRRSLREQPPLPAL